MRSCFLLASIRFSYCLVRFELLSVLRSSLRTFFVQFCCSEFESHRPHLFLLLFSVSSCAVGETARVLVQSPHFSAQHPAHGILVRFPFPELTLLLDWDLFE